MKTARSCGKTTTDPNIYDRKDIISIKLNSPILLYIASS